jgi:hypothetical protein
MLDGDLTTRVKYKKYRKDKDIGRIMEGVLDIRSGSCDIWIGKSALRPAAVELCYSSSFKLLSVSVAFQLFPVTWWRRKIIAMDASRITLDLGCEAREVAS